MGRKGFLPNSSLFFIIAVAVMCIMAAPAVVSTVQAQDMEAPADEGDDPVGEDENDTGDDDEAPAFSNPTQAQKAQNLADALAVKEDPAVQQAMQDLADAKAAGDEDAIADAMEALENARTEALADTDDEYAEIQEMRQEMGWGRIAIEKGIHPSVLGLGNRFGRQNQFREKTKAAHGYGHGKKADMMSSTARDLKTGGAKNFGQANAGKGQGNSNAGGLGQSKDKSNSGKGNSGNNGNNGNGKGKDK